MYLMHTIMDGTYHVNLKVPMAFLIVYIDPSEYKEDVGYKNGRLIIYVKLTKLLYLTLQVALPF